MWDGHPRLSAARSAPGFVEGHGFSRAVRALK